MSNNYLIFKEVLNRVLENITVSNFSKNDIENLFQDLSTSDEKFTKKTYTRIKDYLDNVIKFAVEMIATDLSFLTHRLTSYDFLYLMKFIYEYISIEKKKIDNPTVNKLFTDKARKNIMREFNVIAKEIENINQANPIRPDFPSTISAAYHFFKHKICPIKRSSSSKTAALSVKDYYNLIRELLKDINRTQQFSDFKNLQDPDIVLIVEKYKKIFQRRVRIVLKNRYSGIEISSCYIINELSLGDKDGDLFIKGHLVTPLDVVKD